MSTLEAFTSCNPLEVVNAIALPDAWARHVKQRQTKILTRTSVPLIHPIIKLIEWINISYMINLISNLISRTHNWSRPSKLRWIGNKPRGGQVFMLDKWEVLSKAIIPLSLMCYLLSNESWEEKKVIIDLLINFHINVWG